MDPVLGRPRTENLYQIQEELYQKSLYPIEGVPGENPDMAWVARGPSNIAGRTNGIMFDPNDSTNKRVFAGGVSGGIFVNEIKSSPSTFELENFHGLGLEFEIAVTLSDDLKPEMGPFNKDNIREFIKSLSPAFELIIDRNADYSNINPLSMITDNAWCSGIVMGKELPNWEKLNLDTIRSQLLWNDEIPQDAMIKDANPLESLSWVSNLLTSLGRTIPKDSIIITGSVIKTRAPNKGDHIIYKVEDLSEVEIKII